MGGIFKTEKAFILISIVCISLFIFIYNRLRPKQSTEILQATEKSILAISHVNFNMNATGPSDPVLIHFNGQLI